ncbi:hypothetical protein T265_15308 [Opisthorchis viverrini]|uniref:Uncharacterized protein n=1 Tax=Opisthorchis viverrini TaxID=6198 RepID=A0A074ZZ75_OPIVI|nr:hypothetical protein T265_15308 [Opisthorchis viverrini]KER20484.1 hypothetical protein T265_15308 [Opisthorchis viverrini]
MYSLAGVDLCSIGIPRLAFFCAKVVCVARPPNSSGAAELMAQSSVETFGSIFKSMLSIKQDELKERILCLPFEAKMFLNNSRISFLDGLQTFCRLEKAYYGLQFLATGFLFPRREDYAASYQSLQTGFDQIADVALLDQPSQEYRIAMCLKNICLVRSRLISFYRSVDENPLKLLMECASLCVSVEAWEQELSFPNDDVTVALEPLITVVCAELGVLSKLLRAQSRIADLHFIDSLLCISNASAKLESVYRIFDLPSDHCNLAHRDPNNPCRAPHKPMTLELSRVDLDSYILHSYRSVDENPLKLLMECASLCVSVEAWEQELSFPNDDVTVALEPLITVVCAELGVLSKLLRAQSRIADLHFIDSLLCISNASAKLESVYRIFDLPYNRGSRTHAKPPALLFWLTNFYNVLLTKYTLYWFKVLSDCTSNSDETLEVAGLENPSLVTRVINFQNRTNALYVSVLFDAACQDYPYLGHGFVLPGTAGDTPTGVKSFPPIFTAPLGSLLPVAQVSSALMQISGKLNTGELAEFNKFLYSYDEKLNHTYFIQKLEYRVYLVIVYNGCRSRKDRQVSEFISYLSGVIRLTALSAALRSHVSAFERDCDLVEIISPTKRDALPCVLVDVKYLPDAQKHILSSEAARDRLVQFLGDLSSKPDQKRYTLIALAMVFMDGVDLNLYRSVVQITRPYVKHLSVL